MGKLLNKTPGVQDRPLMFSDLQDMFGAAITQDESPTGKAITDEEAQRMGIGYPGRLSYSKGLSFEEAKKAADALPFKVTWIEKVGPDRWIPRGSDDETGGGAGSSPDAPSGEVPDWLSNYMKGQR